MCQLRIKVLFVICSKTIYWSVLSAWLSNVNVSWRAFTGLMKSVNFVWSLVWFNLLFFSGDITQKGYEKKRSKLLQAYLPHTPGNTHTHTIFYQAAYSFFVLILHLSHCVCCRGRAPHPCHTIFIVFLILPLPTSTVHWHKGWTLPLRWDKGHKYKHTHTHTHTHTIWYPRDIIQALCSLCHNSSKQIGSISSFSESDVIFFLRF